MAVKVAPMVVDWLTVKVSGLAVPLAAPVQPAKA